MENLKEEVLKESYGYKGNLFWENYIVSHMVRTVSKELSEFSPKDIVEMYSDIYGEDIAPIIEYMLSNQEALHEAAKIEGTFLFEEIGAKNINKHFLTEAPELTSAIVTGPAATFRIARGFLGNLWNRVRTFLNKNVFSAVIPFLQKGFAWAKALVKGGINWVSKTPLAQAIIPVLLITGTVKGAKALINKFRKKAKMKTLSTEEEASVDKIAAENKDKIEKTRQEVLTKK